MSLQLNISNSLQNLAAQLATDLAKHPISVFQQQHLITQTDGMNNWLTIQLVAKNGINANCKFLKPNDIVDRLYFWLGGDTKQLPGVDYLKWQIYNLFGDHAFTERFKDISAYYRDDDVRRIALAGRVADLFDQYQVYRPEIITGWNNAADDLLIDDDWQKYTWIKVARNTTCSFADKATIIQYVITQLSDAVQQERLRSKLPALYIFGVSIITQLHIYLFHELSKYISVSFYLLNPAPLVYWLDDKTEKQIAWLAQLQRNRGKQPEQLAGTGNTLLVSWGKVIQETFGLLFENDNFLNVYNDSGVEEPTAGPADTLLKKIQQDIFYNNDELSRNQLTKTDLYDGSLSVNSCYTPVREVESLYNYLVHLTDKANGQLSPRDMVVMVSDVDTYSPYIKAIFNTAVYRFPYTIADESFQSGDTLFTALEAVLGITEDSFKAEEVMQLMDHRFIRERFNITDTTLIRKVVGMANIRFGIEGNEEDDTNLVSWDTGIRRILLGICMSGSMEYSLSGEIIYPMDFVEGNDSLELIRLCHFIEMLKWSVKDRSNNRSLAGWGGYLLQLTDDLVLQADTNDAGEDYQRLLLYVENLQLLTATYDEAISFEVFKHSFLGVLAAEIRSRSFAAGGITFCSLIPMRSIPFKVVALLGMSFDKFPRKDTPLSFNLIEQKRRRGDRNIRENDKHLFLETVLSARQYLYISYIGRNAKDNSIHPPSALVDELLDYVESGVAGLAFKVRDVLITTQPLHGFSQKYFQQLPGIYSYLNVYTQEERTHNKGWIKEAQAFKWAEIPVSALLSFFKNPFKWYYNKVLGIYYNDDEVLLPDTELFELNKLQRWQLKNDLLRLEKEEIQPYRLKALKTGSLPLKHMSDILVADTVDEIQPFKKLFKHCTGNIKEQKIQIDIKIGDTIIAGSIDGVYDDKLVAVSFSKNRYKYLLDAYIKYVLVSAQGHGVSLNFLSAEDNAIFSVPANTYPVEMAKEVLTRLVSWFKKGHTGIFLIYPGLNENPLKLAAFDFVRFNKMISAYLERYAYEYLQKEYDNGLFKNQEAVEQFKENTLAVFSPVAALFPQLIASP